MDTEKRTEGAGIAVYAQETANPNGWQLDTGTPEEINQLEREHGINPGGLAHDIGAGVLRFMDTPEGRAWVVTDRTGICAQARLLSGDLWNETTSPVKLLSGSRNVPLGLEDMGETLTVYVVTGGIDFIVMREILRRQAPEHINSWGERYPHKRAEADAMLKRLSEKVCVAMPDTSTPLTKEQAAAFQFKCVRIFPHRGKDGAAALQSWGRSIKPHATTLDIFEVFDLEREVNGKKENYGFNTVRDLWTAEPDEQRRPPPIILPNVMEALV